MAAAENDDEEDEEEEVEVEEEDLSIYPFIKCAWTNGIISWATSARG